MSSSTHFVISVLAPDRVGLLRDITRVVFDHGGNIHEIRQSIVGGFFNLIFISAHPTGIQADEIRQALATTLGPETVSSVLPRPAPKPRPVADGETFVISTRGPDKPGTILAISAFLVEHGINIEDWLVGDEDGLTIYTARVRVPETLEFRQVQKAFKQAMAELGLDAQLCHENIVRATNEIGPIKSLRI